MTNREKLTRINQAIEETKALLNNAILKQENSLKCLEIEIIENKESGNDDSSNNHAREYVKESKERVNELENHINYLVSMKTKITG